jgi:hypothetical protein
MTKRTFVAFVGIATVAGVLGGFAAGHIAGDDVPAKPATVTAVERPAGAAETPPEWVNEVAFRVANEMSDAAPDSVAYFCRKSRCFITMTGHFICTRCSRPWGFDDPSGKQLRLTVDRATRGVIGLSLRH